jgi:uncharacterized protein (DUF1800 family)
MKSKQSRFCSYFFGVFFTAVSIFSPVLAETDPDPDSPTPILLSEKDSTRALAVNGRRFKGTLPTNITTKSFLPGNNSKIVLFISNLDLMPDEGVNAFGVFIQNEKGTQFRLRPTDLQQVSKTVYALTAVIYDDLGYWGQPEANGDVLVNITWRGLSSNRVRLGLGKIGGEVKDDEGSKPTPLGTVSVDSKIESQDEPSLSTAGYKFSGDRHRFMEQATFGPNPNLDSRIKRLGLRIWLADQFDSPYPTIGYPKNPLKPANPPTDCDNDQTVVPDVPVTCFRDTYTQYLNQNWFIQESLYGNAQLRHRVSWALAQLWVTSGVDVQQSRHMMEYHAILSRNAFGNWRTLMKEMTLSPAMGEYLDMIRSTRTSPNENYAREILQLFNIGLFNLNQDGTVQTSGGIPVDSYDQTTVNNFTKVLTGWTFCANPANCPNFVTGTQNFIDPLWLNTGANHDITAKTLFTYPGSTTTNVPACTGCTGAALLTYANNSLDQALDNIFNHPNVPPFVSRYLIQQLVTGEPSGAYVQRIANVFANNGSNVRGDLKAVVRAILLDPEARGNVKTAPRYGKLREPVQLATNLLRHFNPKSADGLTTSDGVISTQLASMGQNPFRAPTVFNYYPPEYLVPGSTLNSPEFAIMTTGTTVQRSNFINTMVYGRVAVSVPNTPNGTSIVLTDMQAVAASDATGNALLNSLNLKMMGGNMPAPMRASILTAVTAIPAASSLLRAQAAIYLIATSSQYQVQR